ncbi:MAG: DEAD/DEAH box helicase [Bacillota bacterium]
MNSWRYIVYIIFFKEKWFKVGISATPQLDLTYLVEYKKWSKKDLTGYALTKALPIGLAYYIYSTLNTGLSATTLNSIIANLSWWMQVKAWFKKQSSNQCLLESYTQYTEDILDYYNLSDYLDQRWLELEDGAKLPTELELSSIHHLLAGRLLYYEEIKRALGENQAQLRSPLTNLLLGLRLTNRLKIKSSLAYRRQNEVVCQRCGSKQQLVKINCSHCQLVDYYCDNCRLMGPATLCRPLYQFLPKTTNYTNKLDIKPIKPKLDFELTPAQSAAGEKLVKFLTSRQREALVWAVCGAGKSEVSFQAMAEVLSRGGSILFAIPRRDAVVELAARIKVTFPQTTLAVLHGKSQAKFKLAQIVVATTHQTLRFSDKFNLVILDEIDAFPYHNNSTLQLAVRRALHPQGKLIAMTATPGAKLTSFQQDNDKLLIKIPARYHGYPVPEPKLVTTTLEYQQSNKQVSLPEEIIEFIVSVLESEVGQLFIFLPTRELVELVGRKLKELDELDSSEIEYSHGQDSKRDSKRDRFCAGEYSILVSTTIMERAITVPKADVLVLFADWDFIFDTATLIQMAGRAGRSLEYPTGRVWFVGREVTAAMAEALARIVGLNQEAQAKGYLR